MSVGELRNWNFDLDQVRGSFAAETGHRVVPSPDFAHRPWRQSNIWILRGAAWVQTGAGAIDKTDILP